MPTQDNTEVVAEPLTATLIEQWARRVADAKTKAFEAGERRILQETILDYERALAYKEGKIEGSNDTTRKANERVVLAEQMETVRKAEHDERQAKLTLDLALLQWEQLRMRLRLFEAVMARDSVVNVGVTRNYRDDA